MFTRTDATPGAVREPIVIRGVAYEDRGYCRTEFASGYGPVIHTVYCPSYGGNYASSGPECISPSQDGPAIKARRDAENERRKFTPPEHREPRRGPAPSITIARGQATSVLVLRGRPRLPRKEGEWSTWHTFTDPADRTLLAQLRLATGPPRPVEMTRGEAAAVVAEYTARVPTHEFRVVRAHLVVDEEVLA